MPAADINTVKHQFIMNQQAKLISCSISDQGLRKSMQATMSNFRLVESRLLLLDQRIQQTLTTVESRFMQVEQRSQQQNREIYEMQSRRKADMEQIDGKFRLVRQQFKQGNKQVTKLIEFAVAQAEWNSGLESRMQGVREQLQQLRHSNDQYYESLIKKAEKSDMEKTRKDVANTQLRYEHTLKKIKELQEQMSQQINNTTEFKNSIANLNQKVKQSSAKSQEFQTLMKSKHQQLEEAFKKETFREKRLELRQRSRVIQAVKVPTSNVQEVLGPSLDKQTYSKLMKLVSEQYQINENFDRIFDWIETQEKKEQQQQQQRVEEEDKQVRSEEDSRVMAARGKMEVLVLKMTQLQKKVQNFKYTIQMLDSRVDTHLNADMDMRIKNMHIELINLGADLAKKLDTKVDSAAFSSFTAEAEDHYLRIYRLIEERADKLKTKQALSFLQTKIIEVVSVVFDQEQSIKRGLVSKRMVKCLSCDKQVESKDEAGSLLQVSKLLQKKRFLPEGRPNKSQSKFNSILQRSVSKSRLKVL